MTGPRSLGRGRVALSGALLAAVIAGSAAAPAGADVFGSISLLSASPVGQAEYAHDPAISGDGSWMVFDGSVGGVPGVWRRRTEPGAPLEQVAGGDAALPSVSADGRYVSFTTNEGVSLPALTNGQMPSGEPPFEAPGVYVRDMAKAPGEAGAFTLASAKDHSALSLTYEYPGEGEAEREGTKLGATAAGRSAITADGRTVVFVTTARSDLNGPGTPPLQVAVRHLDTQETQLVSVRYDPATGRPAVDPETDGPEPIPYVEGAGAVWSPQGSPLRFSPTGNQLGLAYTVPQLAGASISADGSTVAWLGLQVPEQARTLPGDATTMTQRYAEPLWRRISAGALEPTRRVTGGSDPENPACRASGETELPGTPTAGDPCQGPFATQASSFGTFNAHSLANGTPQLSANGNDVAFIASVPLDGEQGGFPIGGGEWNSDAYWVDMTAPDRRSALRQLTQFASGEADRVSTNANVDDIAISPDGTQVAFTTKRTVFPLGVPAFVSVPAAVPGLTELYDADIADNTLTRVTHGYEGGAASHVEIESSTEEVYSRAYDGALSPSFAAAGNELAFSSTAANLVFGDGNTPALGSSSDFADGSDAFLVPRVLFASEPTPQTISAAPGNPRPEPAWTISVKAVSLPNGVVEIRALVPAPGTLAARASSALPAGVSRRGVRRVRRTVARASTTAAPDTAGTLQLELKLGRSYGSLANRAGGLPGTVTVSFAVKGHPTLRRTVAVRFVHHRARRKR